MKAVILAVFVFVAALGLFYLVHQAYQSDQCRSAGFDRMNPDGMCVYKSRYTNTDYLTPPARAAEFFLTIKGYEEDERKAKGRL